MKNTKSTKHALLTSVMALFLCVTMLLGTTFAWFTDTVTSGVNTIVAGNLDIELEYSKNGTDWYTVQGTDQLFKDVTLWEPGATSVVYLRLTNKGTLDLKYQLDITATGGDFINVAGQAKNLKDALVFAQVAGDTLTTYATREEAVAAVGSTLGLTDYTQSANMVAGATSYITLVVTMPTTIGNDFNYKTGTPAPKIDLGIKLVATQLASERDSFDNQYDKDAVYPLLMAYLNETTTAVKPESGDIVIETPVAKSTVPAVVEIKSGVSPLDSNNTISDYAMVTGSSLDRVLKTTDYTADSVTYDISYVYTETSGSIPTSYNVSEFSGIVTNVIELSTGLKEVKVTHSHGGSVTPMTMLTAMPSTIEDNTAYYNPTTGDLTIWSSKYSSFKIEYESDFVAAVNGQGYGTLQEAVNVANLAPETVTVTLLKDVTLTADVKVGTGDRGVNLNLNGKIIDGGIYQVYTGGEGITSIFGGTIKNNNTTASNSDVAALYIPSGSSVVLDDVTLSGYYGVYVNGNVDIKNAVINAVYCGIAANYNAQITIGSLSEENNITVTASNGNCISTQAAAGAEGMSVTVFDGSFTSSGTDWTICPIYWASHGTLNLYGGTFINETSGTGAAGLLQKNGTVNVYGGSFEARDGIKIVAQSDSTEIVTKIEGGAFTGTRSGIYIDASNSTYMGRLTQYSISIANNGDAVPQFVGGTEGAIYAKTNGLGSRTLMTIFGGRFNEDPSSYLVDGKMATQGTDGLWVVTDPPASWAYVTNEAEFNTALSDTEKDRIIIKNDIVFTSTKKITRTVTVDLGTNELTTADKDGSYSASVFQVEYNGDLTLLGKPDSLIKSGNVINAQYQEGNPTIKVYSPGKLTIDGVNVEGHNMTGKEVTSYCTAGEAIEITQKNGNTDRGALVINNATVKSGELPGNEQSSGFGNALSVGGNVDVTLTNCIFSAGYTHGGTYPATIKIGGKDAVIYMENCTVTAPDLYYPQYGDDHRAAAGIYNAGSKMTLIDCSVYGKNNKSYTQGAISINGTCEMYFKNTIVQADGNSSSTYDISITYSSARPTFYVAGTDNISGLRFYNRNYITIVPWVE